MSHVGDMMSHVGGMMSHVGDMMSHGGGRSPEMYALSGRTVLQPPIVTHTGPYCQH